MYENETLQALYETAIVQKNKKAKLALFEYALVYEDNQYLSELAKVGFKPANNPKKGIALLTQKYFMAYQAKKAHNVINQVNKYGIDHRNPFNQTPLMIASLFGKTTLIKTLHEHEPNTDLVDNNQRNALQIALEQACQAKDYAKQSLVHIYHSLTPDSVDIKVDGRLIKLNNHLMEFVVLNIFISIFYRMMPQKLLRNSYFQAGDIIEAVEAFPDSVLLPKRKKRSYINSILAKNEVSRNEPYNRKLFKRLRVGHYVFNPDLSIKIGDEWVGIYDICQIERLRFHLPNKPRGWPSDDIIEVHMEVMKKDLLQLVTNVEI